MPTTIPSRALFVLLGLALAAPAFAKGKEGKASPGGGYSLAQAVETARALAQKAGMTVDKQEVLFKRLDKHFESIVSKHDGKPISGVIAYQMGEGGLIVKVKKGKGFIRFHGDKEDHAIELKSVSVGANVGGSSEWGVGLVFGLSDRPFFGGDYSGTTRGATAGEASTNTTDLAKAKAVDPAEYHQIVLLGTAAGLSANAGSAKLTIRLVD